MIVALSVAYAKVAAGALLIKVTALQLLTNLTYNESYMCEFRGNR